MESTCPQTGQLRAFALGDLAAAEMERVAEHVAGCPTCDQSLAAWDGCKEGLLGELESLHTGHWHGDARLSREFVEGVATRVLGADDAGDLTFDHGKRLARRLAAGPCHVGRFELQAEIGEGSFGHVFRAYDSALDRTVAVKVQRAGGLAHEDDVRRFLHEAQSAAQLQHPGIVALYDSGRTEDGICYLVTQLIEGETLEQRLKDGSFTPQQAASQIVALADTIHYAHEHGVVHRDVKPSNVILDAAGQPHVTDFGLAKRDAVDSLLTSDGRVMGTPAYMSPEQARGDSHGIDARTDVYSLGVVLYEMLTGERPFQGNRRLLLLQVLEDEPRSPRRLNEHVPKDLETICLKAMAKSPTRRYATARELADDLRRFLNGEPIQARPIGRIGRLYRWCRRYPLAAGLILAVSMGSLVGFSYLTALSRYFVESTALASVRMEADMLESINEYYSDEIIGRLNWQKVKISRDYVGKDDTIPLPATLLIDAGDHISRNHTGMEVRLFSQFPWRANGGPKDDFERRAIRALEQRRMIDREHHEFSEKGGRLVVRYARAQIMKESCIKCHNNDPTSPKRDWREGDLVGVLSITRPMDQDIERTQSGLQGAFLLVGGVAVLLLGFSFAYVSATRRAHGPYVTGAK